MTSEDFVFHHVGVAVPSLSAAIPVYGDLFGYRLVSGPFDDPLQKVSVCFLGRSSPGDISLELVAPLGDDSPIGRTLTKGGGAYHVCYTVPNAEAALSHALAHGCLLVSQAVPAVAFDHRRIAWFYTPSRQLIEVLEA